MDKRKSESIAVRLDPKIRFGLDLMVRKQRRNLSSVVEWAIQEMLENDFWGDFKSMPDVPKEDSCRPMEIISFLWHEDPFERIKLMKIYCPNLLTVDEEIILRNQNL